MNFYELKWAKMKEEHAPPLPPHMAGRSLPLSLNIYYQEPPNYMVVCIPQMLFNLNKAFKSDPWA